MNPVQIESKIEHIDDFTAIIYPFGLMKVPVTLFLSRKIKVESEALMQIADAASIDSDSFVFATPDIHTGYGVPIGSILASPNIISPSAVGYDINCGMRLLKTPFLIKDINTKRLAEAIFSLIPAGEGKKNLELSGTELKLVLNSGLESMSCILPRFNLAADSSDFELLALDIEGAEDKGQLNGDWEALPARAMERGMPQMGTLGGGNHFIEVQEVTEIFNEKIARAFGLFKNQAVVMLHSGSRGLGHETAGYYIKKAKNYLARNGIRPPNGQLLYFFKESKEADQYLKAMNAAANYAFANRQVMTMLIRKAFKKTMGKDSALQIKTLYDVTHNMAKKETFNGKSYFVHRKGATRAFDSEHMKGTPFEKTGQPILIPGSMGTASYILAGTEGSKRSFYSVNHGAGRAMSRKQAAGKKGCEGAISDREFHSAMKNIFLLCENKRRIKEEAPQAYKDIDAVIETVIGAGLAETVAKIQPVAVIKG
ncbi:MAG: hypothetical protein DRP57_02205 [Spirochaetes bacterium]|nr:MAG: hypothetical protein DRP57_02205 [Spirochaetota bacterium]